MTTQLIDKPAPNILKRDPDGNIYSLPQSEVSSFVSAAETVENIESMTGEWFDAVHELNARFGEYRIE